MMLSGMSNCVHCPCLSTPPHGRRASQPQRVRVQQMGMPAWAWARKGASAHASPIAVSGAARVEARPETCQI